MTGTGKGRPEEAEDKGKPKDQGDGIALKEYWTL